MYTYKNDYNPLVSIIVVSYNSEDTITETLDSLLFQNYKNFEVVVSDDCSSDGTVAKIKQWISSHEEELWFKILLLESGENKGVCKNLNKAIRVSTGLWIKPIAADDKLLPNCCEDNLDFIRNNPQVRFVSSYQDVYNDTFNENNLETRNSAYRRLEVFDKSAEQQLKLMAFQIFVMAPTMFYQRSLYEEVGGYDEHYPYEDHPFYVKILEHGTKLHFMPKATVAYRIHQSAYNSDTKLFNFKFALSSKKFRKEHCFIYYGLRQKIAVNCYYALLSFIENCHLNKKTPLLTFLFVGIRNVLWKFGRPIV